MLILKNPHIPKKKKRSVYNSACFNVRAIRFYIEFNLKLIKNCIDEIKYTNIVLVTFQLKEEKQNFSGIIYYYRNNLYLTNTFSTKEIQKNKKEKEKLLAYLQNMHRNIKSKLYSIIIITTYVQNMLQ